MTFADLVANLDKAAAPIIAVLDKAGPQWMTGPNNTVQVWSRDSSALGFHVQTSTQASLTQVDMVTGTIASQLATAKAMLTAAQSEVV